MNLVSCTAPAGHVRVRAAVVDRGVVAPGQDVAVVVQQRLDLAACAVGEACDQRPGGGADGGDILGRPPAHGAELAAQVGGGAVRAERDGVDDPVGVRVPRRDRVRLRGAEAEHVVPGVSRSIPSDRVERPHRGHGAPALHQLPNLLECPGGRQLGCAGAEADTGPSPPAGAAVNMLAARAGSRSPYTPTTTQH